MKNFKKSVLSIVLVLSIGILMTACGLMKKVESGSKKSNQTGVENQQSAKEKTATNKNDLTVFAAASLTESLNTIKSLYERENPNINLVFNFDSSGTLKTQIENGAECDMFISAAPKQINQLDIKSDPSINTNALDYILERVDLLENKVALAVPDSNPKNINSYGDLVEALKNKDVLLGMGNSDVPVGQYTQKILKYFELNEEELANNQLISYGSNVKEVTTQVKESVVSCGIIYQTDAKSAGLKVVDTATKEMCGRVIYPMAVLKTSKKIDEARRFYEYLRGIESSSIFSSIGFTPLS